MYQKRSYSKRNTYAAKPIVPQNELSASFAPSELQSAIAVAVDKFRDSIMVQATAGSGKTTTLLYLFRILQGKDVVFLAFGKAIAEELKTRVPQWAIDRVFTLHSYCFRILASVHKNLRFKVEAHNTYNIFSSIIPDGTPRKANICYAGERIVSMAKDTLCDINNIDDVRAMMVERELDANGDGEFALTVWDAACAEMNRRYERGIIDFSDMIWRPIIENIIVPKVEVILADEIQDFNPAQIEMTRRMIGRGARFIGVGDTDQSIFGFRGADVEAWDKLIIASRAKEMPLSISYRLPQTHVELAQSIVGAERIQARPNAPIGTINYDLNLDQLFDNGIMVADTLALCRINAPLISVAYAAMRRSVPVMIRGNDIGRGLRNMIEKLSATSVVDLIEKVNIYRENEIAKLTAIKASQMRISALSDKCDTIIALTEGMNTVDQILNQIDVVFRDTDGKGFLVLSSVHRAKGLEANTVVILKPSKLPLSRKDMSEKDMIQERNLQFVAYTRSRDKLYFEKEVTSAKMPQNETEANMT